MAARQVCGSLGSDIIGRAQRVGRPFFGSQPAAGGCGVGLTCRPLIALSVATVFSLIVLARQERDERHGLLLEHRERAVHDAAHDGERILAIGVVL